MKTEYSVQRDLTLKAAEKVADWAQQIKIAESANTDGIYGHPCKFKNQVVTIKGKGLTPRLLKIEHNDGAGKGWALNELSPQALSKS
jgi:hypothetical protein